MISLKDRLCIIMRYHDFSIFKIPAISHLGFLKLKLLTAVNRDTFFINMPYFTEIGHTIAQVSQFFLFFLVKCKNSLGVHSSFGGYS